MAILLALLSRPEPTASFCHSVCSALREFGEDPATAHVRDVGTVERYEG